MGRGTWGLDRQLGCRQSSPDADAPQSPSRTPWDCKTEKPAQPGQQSPGRIWAIRMGQSPLQETTPSSSAPGFTLTCGSTSTWSQGTQLGQPQPCTSSPRAQLSTLFVERRNRSIPRSCLHPSGSRMQGSIRGTRQHKHQHPNATSKQLCIIWFDPALATTSRALLGLSQQPKMKCSSPWRDGEYLFFLLRWFFSFGTHSIAGDTQCMNSPCHTHTVQQSHFLP